MDENSKKQFKADLLDYCADKGIAVTDKLSVDTIIKRITAHENKIKQLTEDNIVVVDSSSKDDSVEAQAKKLIRCKITCHNGEKNSLGGEILSVGNAVIPEQRKFIAYNKPYHITQLMYNVLKEKTFTRYKTVNTDKKKSSEPFQSPEYTIEVLPPLTNEEYETIRQRQLRDVVDQEEMV